MTVIKNKIDTYHYTVDLSVDEMALVLRTLRRATDKNPATYSEETDIHTLKPIMDKLGRSL